MKRELYREDRDDGPKFNTIFSNLHQPPPQLHPSAALEWLPPSDREQEEDSSGRNPAVIKVLHGGDHLHPPPHDGATIEVVRRPRGRPPGSRNKPKPPLIVSKAPTENSMSPYILELPAGVDVIAAATRFCRDRKLGLCILTGSGAISNITVKQPQAVPVAGSGAVTFHGRFDILSMSGLILDQSGVDVPVNGQFTVYVAAGPQGQVVGGVVVGPLVSAATVYMVAGAFSGHTFCRLRNDDGEDTSRSDVGEYQPPISGGAPEHCTIGSLYS